MTTNSEEGKVERMFFFFFLKKKKFQLLKKLLWLHINLGKGLINLHFLLKHPEDKIGAPYEMHDLQVLYLF